MCLFPSRFPTSYFFLKQLAPACQMLSVSEPSFPRASEKKCFRLKILSKCKAEHLQGDDQSIEAEKRFLSLFQVAFIFDFLNLSIPVFLIKNTLSALGWGWRAQNLSRTWAEQVRPLTRYSQHTQAVDSRHRVAVPEQVAAVAAVLAQPPLALRFADGSVVDGQVLHLHLVCDAPGRSAIRLPAFLSPFFFFFSFFPFLGPPVRLSTNCKANPSRSLLCLRRVSGRVKTLRFSWLLSFASSQQHPSQCLPHV